MKLQTTSFRAILLRGVVIGVVIVVLTASFGSLSGLFVYTFCSVSGVCGAR